MWPMEVLIVTACKQFVTFVEPEEGCDGTLHKVDIGMTIRLSGLIKLLECGRYTAAET